MFDPRSAATYDRPRNSTGDSTGAGTGRPQGGTAILDRVEEQLAADTPWQVVLHNDPVNLVGYVTRTLVKVLKCAREDAERYMMLAHTLGKAAVFDGTQNECEAIATELGAHSLWATLEKAGQ